MTLAPENRLAPPREFEEFEIKESEGSKKGWWYEGAHVTEKGEAIPIYNEDLVQGEEG